MNLGTKPNSLLFSTAHTKNNTCVVREGVLKVKLLFFFSRQPRIYVWGNFGNDSKKQFKKQDLKTKKKKTPCIFIFYYFS